MTLPVFHISRLRFGSDGKGITSLVGISGCPNRCKYCINSRWLTQPSNALSARKLYDLVSVDDIYFQATGGGITFGGGEPLLHPDGILAFARLVNKKWKINIETSLNVPWEHIEPLLPHVDSFIVDVKDMNEYIYFAYTGTSGSQMRSNLAQLASRVPHKIVVRVPLIPGFNTPDDVSKSKQQLSELGITELDAFTYKERPATWG